MPEPLCTFTLTRYPLRQAWWAMAGVGRDRPALETTPGLRFVRQLGTGQGANLRPGADLSRWAMFAVWDSATAWEAFEGSALRREQRARAQESSTALLRPLRWHGRWGGHDPFAGIEPFAGTKKAQPTGGPVAALTRATLRPARLLPFWRAVPRSMHGLYDNPGLIASVGIGEVPLLHQATFSLWQSEQALNAFAYGGAGHREAMSRARAGQWFQEELFARFEVLGTRGLWDGR